KGATDRFLMMAAIRLVGVIFGLCVLPFVPMPSVHVWSILLAATAAHYAYYYLLLRSYHFGDLSLIYPIARGLTPIILAVASFLMLGERLTTVEIGAVALT